MDTFACGNSMYVYTYVCMYVCMYVYLHVCICMYVPYSGLFSRGNFVNTLWCDLSRAKISQMVYKALNKITIRLRENICK